MNKTILSLFCFISFSCFAQPNRVPGPTGVFPFGITSNTVFNIAYETVLLYGSSQTGGVTFAQASNTAYIIAADKVAKAGDIMSGGLTNTARLVMSNATVHFPGNLGSITLLDSPSKSPYTTNSGWKLVHGSYGYGDDRPYNEVMSLGWNLDFNLNLIDTNRHGVRLGIEPWYQPDGDVLIEPHLTSVHQMVDGQMAEVRLASGQFWPNNWNVSGGWGFFGPINFFPLSNPYLTNSQQAYVNIAPAATTFLWSQNYFTNGLQITSDGAGGTQIIKAGTGTSDLYLNGWRSIYGIPGASFQALNIEFYGFTKVNNGYSFTMNANNGYDTRIQLKQTYGLKLDNVSWPQAITWTTNAETGDPSPNDIDISANNADGTVTFTNRYFGYANLQAGNITSTGTNQAAYFVGNGSLLSDLPSNLDPRFTSSAGTITALSNTFLASYVVAPGSVSVGENNVVLSQTGDVDFTGIATGSGAGLTAIPAAGITLAGPGIVGRETSGSGVATLIPLGGGLAFSNGLLVLTGTGGEATNTIDIASSTSVVTETNGLLRTLRVTTSQTNQWRADAALAAQYATNGYNWINSDTFSLMDSGLATVSVDADNRQLINGVGIALDWSAKTFASGWAGGNLSYDGSANNGNLGTGVNTLQELNDAVDNLVLGGGTNTYPIPSGTVIVTNDSERFITVLNDINGTEVGLRFNFLSSVFDMYQDPTSGHIRYSGATVGYDGLAFGGDRYVTVDNAGNLVVGAVLTDVPTLAGNQSWTGNNSYENMTVTNLTILNFDSAKSNKLAISSITVTGSPFNWTNTSGANVNVLVDGVSVTGTVGINGTTIWSTIGQNTVPLQNNEWTTITYTIGTPTAFWKPL